MQPRYYQEEAKAAVLKEWFELENQRTLLEMATGTGKTIVFAHIIEHLVAQGMRVLVLAHRGELLDQAADKIALATGLGCSVEKADQTCFGDWFRVVVGSVQSLMRPKRLKKFPTDYFDAIIVDEAHHALADSYQKIFKHFSNAFVLGVTATPDRGDLRNLGEFFQSLAYQYNLPTAIKDGFLSPIRALSIPLELDMRGVKKQAGDYQAAAIGSALDPYLAAIADQMIEHCLDRKTIVFLPLIATSQKMCNILLDRGFRCAEINGESDNRRETLNGFADGKYNCICNSMLLTEGYDCPSVDCIVPLRITKIRSLFAQMVGRGTRLYPGKEYLLLLDFLWNTAMHDLCRPALLIAESQDLADSMTDLIQQSGKPVDLESVEKDAESDCVKKREEAMAEKLERLRKRKLKLVDPLQYEMSIQSEDLAGYVPSFGWESEPAKKQQLKAIEKAGLFSDEITTRGKAEKVLSALSDRRNRGLTTPKQIRFLESKGFNHVGTWQFDDARRLIDRIAGNNWRIPHGISPSTYQPKQQKKEEKEN